MRKRMYVTAIFFTAVIIVSSLVIWYCSGMKNSISPQAAEYHTTYVSDKDGLAGLVDYDINVDYIISPNDETFHISNIQFQKYIDGVWIDDDNSPFDLWTGIEGVQWDYIGFVDDVYVTDEIMEGVTFTDNRIVLTFQDGAFGSDGHYHDIVIIISNIYNKLVSPWRLFDSGYLDGFVDLNGKVKTDNFFAWNKWGFNLNGYGRSGAGTVAFDISVLIPDASSSDSMFMVFEGLDVPGWSNWVGDFAHNNGPEGVMIKSGIFPGTSPHVPSDYILRIEDGEMPAYYASVDVVPFYPCVERCGVSYLAQATGTTFRWCGGGAGTTFSIFANLLPHFTIYTNVRVESESSNVMGDKTYEPYFTADYKQYISLMNASYSYTYTKDMLSAEDWMFEYSDTTVGGSGITEDTTYYIDIDRNRYTYSFDANLPVDRGASDLSGMPNDKTVVASYAESGKSDTAVSSPSLPGYWFKGWSTSSDDTSYVNQYPGAETMKSNKTFYAMWQRADYTVHFDANRLYPASQEGEYTQNSVSGTMPDQTLDYDVYQNLNANTFTREGYTFAGWNTKPDGSGTSYNDEQSVRNLTGYDNAEITLYAQWEKKLGTETITVISEGTGNPVSGVNMTLQKNVDGRWTDVVTGTTNASGTIVVNDLHWFDYRWVITSVPAGYEKPSSYETFIINYNRLSAANEVILYMKRVSITLDSRVSDIIPGENSPAFLYHISGRDVAGISHEYNVMVQTDGTGYGTETVTGLFAGEYSITQTAVSRYIPGTPKNISNITIKGTGATADVKNNASAEVLFPYSIREYGWYSGTDSTVNSLTK